jgi:hypothetical protein
MPDTNSTSEETYDWLIPNYGPRCTLVCAASVLRKLGAESDSLVEVIERTIGFKPSGPPARAYLGPNSPLDRGIAEAGRAGGIAVRSKTRFLVHWKEIVESLAAGVPVVLNCYRAPSGRWSHSVLAIDCDRENKRLLTLDPNDAIARWMTWNSPTTGWICTATFIQRTVT